MRGCRPLADSEISRLLDVLHSPSWRQERALIVLGLRMGLRLTSMLSLRLGDVVIEGAVQTRIRVRRGPPRESASASKCGSISKQFPPFRIT